ncbi:para-hydroxybenzoate-polyprenyltransferase [Polychytrium aggregatum]|uniref:para-hydroxybenzoate-polyprenyltransferase n=1 Tax=Polychytrium aggregatum TaxID=110093 RepID=UPI0022FE4308|nr:para-hydroxybenzoate-polyprenyltransferase [Polychytrium aggregatum]KAI9209655.1 para-hydroxybenzoate-polyprenyltransferase [Polychytrium aggregatum]
MSGISLLRVTSAVRPALASPLRSRPVAAGLARSINIGISSIPSSAASFGSLLGPQIRSTSLGCRRNESLGRHLARHAASGHQPADATQSSSASTGSHPGPAPVPAPVPIPSSFRWFPQWTHPYLFLARVDKPAGTYLLLLPCFWSIAMATYATPAISMGEMAYMMSLFSVGAFVMRGAGCTINDMWDRKIDKLVERTKVRPIASGQVSMFQALTFLGCQLSTGLAVLTQLNWYSIGLGALSLCPVIIYPFMKRVTYWPQAVLGIAFNWGALLGWAAMLGSSNWAVTLPLYAAGICWTLVYDTIYALQDIKDDVKVGVKSTAIRFGRNIISWLSAFAAGTLSLLCISGYANDQGPLYYLVSVGGAGAHFLWQITTLKTASVEDAARKFRANARLGSIIAIGIIADTLMQRYGPEWCSRPAKSRLDGQRGPSETAVPQQSGSE